MEERRLATIQKIDAINPIEGADKIEVASVGGWKVVTQKGTFKAGDPAVFVEIDSWVPLAVAPFLRKPGHPEKLYNEVDGERLRTVRLRGQVSQGLLLPLTVLPPSPRVMIDVVNNHATGLSLRNRQEGDDVTNSLGIQLWERPIAPHLAGVVKGNFPSFIPKTNQERVQNCAKELSYWLKNDNLWEVTEKLDGSSMTVYVKDDYDGVCSKNLDLLLDSESTYWKVANVMELHQKIRTTKRHLAIQGELVGEGIQKNPYGYKGHTFLLFDIYDIDNAHMLSPEERQSLVSKLQINHVPFVGVRRVKEMEELIAFAEGKSQLHPGVEREGVVFKCFEPSRFDGKFDSFKSINNKYLLNEKD